MTKVPGPPAEPGATVGSMTENRWLQMLEANPFLDADDEGPTA